MKLSELKNNELESVLNMTEKYMERLARDIRVMERTPRMLSSDLHKKYGDITVKYKMICNEVNKRISEIEE